MKLPFKRFIAQASTAPARSKSSYLAMMAENLEELKKCQWRAAANVPASLTGHDFTASTQFSDAYDAYKLTGNYDSKAMTEIAYAGMAAYRFTLPAAAISGEVPLASVSLPVCRDRFEKSGLHLAVVLSDSADPATDWATVRGSESGAVAPQEGLLAPETVTHLTAGVPADGTATFDLSGVSTGNPAAYLWVYVTLEDYTDCWAMYNAKEKRLYAVEGSAMLIGQGAEFTFDDDVAEDGAEDGAETGKYLVHPIPVHVGYWHYPTMPKLRFRTSHWMGEGDWRHLVPTSEWDIPAGTFDFPFVCELETAGRRIPVGDGVLECWIDEGGDDFSPGMPYGCDLLRGLVAEVRPPRAEIELSRTSPTMVRINLVDAMKATSATADAAHFAAVNATTDRSRFNIHVGHNANTAISDGAATDLSGFNTTSLTRVRLVRTLINGVGNTYRTTVFDYKINLSARQVMTEADVLAALVAEGKFDLDWGTLNTAARGGSTTASPLQSIASATYRIVIGDCQIDDVVLTNENANETSRLPLLFTNIYDSLSKWQEPTTPGSCRLDGDGKLIISWSHLNAIDKVYPAFQFRIYGVSNGTADKDNVIYDSGPIKAPARDERRMYEWKLPFKEGDTVTYNGNSTVFAPHNAYWSVSMMDAKHTWFGEDETTNMFEA